MMKGFVIQDTIRKNSVIWQDTLKHLPDSVINNGLSAGDTPLKIKAVSIHLLTKTEPADTSSLCYRNRYSDIAFNDSSGVIQSADIKHIQNFPFVFTGINKKLQEETRASLVRHLKNGEERSTDLFHYDWVLFFVFISALIIGVIKAESGNFFKGLLRFITFRGMNESASRDIASFFQWQSTLFNLASVITISLFAFFSALQYSFVPIGGNRILFWILLFTIIAGAVILRHLLCVITGNISGEKEIFREYLFWIYQGYRLTGIFLLLISILILYTFFIPADTLFYCGFSLLILVYIIRVFRLFLIFINRHVSIFYLILYLCALEILPVAILIKYVTGLA
jgi:hypothetical protein